MIHSYFLGVVVNIESHHISWSILATLLSRFCGTWFLPAWPSIPWSCLAMQLKSGPIWRLWKILGQGLVDKHMYILYVCIYNIHLVLLCERPLSRPDYFGKVPEFKLCRWILFTLWSMHPIEYLCPRPAGISSVGHSGHWLQMVTSHVCWAHMFNSGKKLPSDRNQTWQLNITLNRKLLDFTHP